MKLREKTLWACLGMDVLKAVLVNKIVESEGKKLIIHKNKLVAISKEDYDRLITKVKDDAVA